MSNKRKVMAETAGDGQMAVSGRGNEKNGHKRPSRLLSWYFAQSQTKGLSYVLTRNGYQILPADPARSEEGIDKDELMM